MQCGGDGTALGRESIIENPDASGKIIYDPETADRNYEEYNEEDGKIYGWHYTEFIGYFQVKALNYIFI